MKRLNGWQRLWVVISVVWVLGAGLVSWASWPSQDSLAENAPLQFEVSAPDGETLELTSEEDRPPNESELNAIFAAVIDHADLKITGGRTLEGTQWNRTSVFDSGARARKANVEGLGVLEFPSGVDTEQMNATVLSVVRSVKEQANKAAAQSTVGIQTPYGVVEVPVAATKSAARDAYSEKLREGLRAQRINTLAWALALCLIPPAMLGVGGWAIAWVYRGFKPLR